MKRVANHAAVDDFLVEVCTFAMENGESLKCQGVFERIIGHTNNKRYELADLLGNSFKDTGLHSKAYKYFFKSRNVEQICSCMKQVMQSGYASEQDLFVARACVEMLLKSTEIEKTRAIRNHFKSQP